MIPGRASVGALIVGGLLVAASARGEALFDASCTMRPRMLPIAADGISIQSQEHTTLWLTIEETGHQLKVREEHDAAVLGIVVPYRQGRFHVALEPGHSVRVERGAPTSQLPQARVQSRCGSDAPDAARQEWLRAVSAVTQELVGFMAQDAAQALLARIDTLAPAAVDAADRALIEHLRAQTLLLGGRSADAADAFATAAASWLQAHDAARARVATMAHVEELLRLARHAEVLPLVQSIPDALADRDYFGARLKLSGCLALRYLGRMTDALPCFEHGVRRMQSMDERLDAVSAMQDMADVQRFLGNTAAARALGESALRAATEPGMETHRGRIALLLADLASRDGNIESTLEWLDRALVEFGAAKAVRWEASALLASADLYIELEALEEASDLVAAALRRLSIRDAPARVAAAQVRQAKIALAAHRYDEARRILRQAAAAFQQLDMPAELDSARAWQTRLSVTQGAALEAEKTWRARDTGQTLNLTEWTLLDGEIGAALGDCARADQAMAKLNGKALALGAEVRRVEVMARCLADRGKHQAAQALLRSSADQIVSIAARVKSSLLRQMLSPHVADLRKTAFAVPSPDATAQGSAVEDAWLWLQRERAVRVTRKGTGDYVPASGFDVEVARFLLATDSARSEAANGGGARSLLSLLAGHNSEAIPADTAPTAASVADFQSRLTPGALFISLIDAGPHSKLLWLSSDAAALTSTDDPETWRALAEELTTLAGDPNTSLAVLESKAHTLALRSLPAALPDRPDRLWIDAGSALASIPWPLLKWPRSATALAEATEISLTHASLGVTSPPLRLSDVRIFAAAPNVGGAQAPLFNTGNESELIANVLASHGRRVWSDVATDREALIAAFDRVQPWIHIASHGSSVAARMGYAGVWIDSTQPSAGPQFVSWLDILARGASAELVVLNACDLADSSSRWMSFADAVARAGARNVVAARWQVSDGAASSWVPTFYASLARGDEVASALAHAQRRLRTSRNYRHPSYWASFVHIGAL